MTSLELQDRNPPPLSESEHEPSHDRENAYDIPVVEQNLAPADSGAAAWRLLVVAFVFEALLWGQYIPSHFHINNSESRTDSNFRLSALFWCVSELLLPTTTVRK